jgi:hypothetical protein
VVKDIGEDHDVRGLAILVFQKVASAERDHVSDPRLGGEFGGLGNRLLAFQHHGPQARVRPAERGPHQAMRAGDIEAKPSALFDWEFFRHKGSEFARAFRHGPLVQTPLVPFEGPMNLDTPAGFQNLIEAADPLPLRCAESHEVSERVGSVGTEVFEAQASQRPQGRPSLDVAHRREKAQDQIEA